MFNAIVTILVRDLILDALYAPIWWYTEGLALALRSFARNARYGANVIGIGIWAHALFKPMYGEHSWQGRIVSFVMRLLVLVWDIAIYFILVAFLFIFVVFWIMLPPVIVWQLTRLWT